MTPSRSEVFPAALGLAGRTLRVRLGRFLAAFANRRFRGVLLLVVGAPAVGAYFGWFFVFSLQAPHTTDFGIYMQAAQDLVAGRDPYSRFRSVAGIDPTLTPFYIYPPVLAWLLQPLTRLSGFHQNLVALAVLHAAILAAVYATCRALKVTDWQEMALYLILTVTFFPIWQNLILEQVNPLLMALGAFWLWGWTAAGRSGALGGGMALGLSVAFKLIQAPLLLLVAVRRRWSLLAATLATAAALSLAASAWLLPEYLAHVLFKVGGGTGQFLNQAPAALVTRLARPISFYRTTPLTGPELTLTAAALAAVVIALTAMAMREPARTRPARALEGAAALAATPLLLPLVWDTHLVLLLPVVFVLLHEAIRRRSGGLAAAVMAAWLLLGPAHGLFILTIDDAVSRGLVDPMLQSGRLLPGLDLWLRALAEAGAAGMLLLWGSALWTLRTRSEP